MAASNLYHVLNFLPATEAWEMPPALEAMAQRLVASGKLRIHTDSARNFVRMSTADTDETFTERELTDPKLVERTKSELARHVPGGLGVQGVLDLQVRLLDELKRTGKVSAEKEIRVARVMVQSAHPAVVMLMLERGTDVFVSYAHNVADLMPVHFWETHGTASGMQATGRREASVYVSCGGDPFFEGEEKTYTTDGFPSLARMVTIAGQETGHFSDLIHTPGGILGRYSTDNSSMALRPSPIVRGARRADMRRIEELRKKLNGCGLPLLRRAERGVAFYNKRLRFSPPWLFYQCWRAVALAAFALESRRHKLSLPLRTYPALARGEATELFLADMAFNLAPDADAYKRPDPLEEEAIACIEALARVPQQSNKWGHISVTYAWPELSRFYYGTVVPGTMGALHQSPPSININNIQRLTIFIRRLLRRRPDYFPA